MSGFFTLRARADLSELDALMERLEAFEGPPAPLAVSGVERNIDEWWVEALFDTPPDAAALSAWLGRPVDVSGLADRNWVKTSLEGLKPVQAGRFIVYGAHDRARVPPNLTGLEIEASLAFGTGHHGTTLGCLIALDRLLKHRRFAKVLDVGCGTGVLALATARVQRRLAFATDIDPIAVRVTEANAKANGAARWIRAVTANGLSAGSIRAAAPFDLIFANILARPLVRLAPDIARASRPGGIAILSGILNTQARWVLGIYRTAGFQVLQRLEQGEWTIWVLKKS